MKCEHLSAMTSIKMNGDSIMCTCCTCGQVINKEIHEWVNSGKLLKDINPNRIWITSSNKSVPFEKITFIHLQNICKKIKQAIVNPEDKQNRAFLKKNSPAVLTEMLKFLEEKKILHTDKTNI